ncbi:MAG: phenylalanine--tRNA ligase subunit alpha [Candidatus Kerfeldbacteria bacterium RIFCSPHIGHO2_12_FULL_48_17]|uniref:Phenylalanine--tRNA ligase alpha subunit n=1 Tax=Candidatus Kerfeldbacteria bacterium RIFCSPHIGHO2_12_FULL_48_17 TaxID=1798542 RepID=A0A1G2AXT7_9BACT|nr:MAG: phenylalanine--tRNA ligase subunit alpha [Candidatus Kerfeldbacteria bacterium RIFCSPHIGHO2_12_FULL_48_17]
MEQQLKTLETQLETQLKKLGAQINQEIFMQLKNTYLGRNGKLAEIMKTMKQAASADRPAIGKIMNTVKTNIEQRIAALGNRTGGGSTTGQAPIDLTAPGTTPKLGKNHPITQMIYAIYDIFESLNFEIGEGPEIENDWYNFDALNMPTDHPARDMQDTFVLPENLLLRTQMTAVSAREMEQRKPPVRIISIGKTFRRDPADISHTPMFHQFDGIMVDEHINMGHLRGLLHTVMERIFEKKLRVRFRISYFPFVEPGAEFDVSCTICDQKGCPTCKGTGWLEMGGCGMLHPKVLENVGYDPMKVQGLAFGFGVERPVMIKYKISDIRLFYQNDLRFLQQF